MANWLLFFDTENKLQAMSAIKDYLEAWICEPESFHISVYSDIASCMNVLYLTATKSHKYFPGNRRFIAAKLLVVYVATE